MSKKEITFKKEKLIRRRKRIRSKVFGTPEQPRVSVFRSVQHIYVQVIDDLSGKTLVSASNLELGSKKGVSGTKIEQAKKVGLLLAKKAQKANISKVVFDRGGRIFHGRVKAVAEGLREGGLIF